MSRFEFYNSQGLRIDGRRNYELKNFESSLTTTSNFNNFSRNSQSSTTYLQMGQNKILVNIDGPKEPANANKSKIDQDKAILDININVTKFSKVNRQVSTNNNNLPDKQTQEWEFEVKKLFEKIIIMESYPKSIINVAVTVLQQDGGILASIINCVSIALMNNSIQVYDIVTACSVGVVDQMHFLLDLNHLEEQFLTSGTIAVVGGSPAQTSEEANVCLLSFNDIFPLDLLDGFMMAGVNGCNTLKDIMVSQVKAMNINKLIEIQ